MRQIKKNHVSSISIFEFLLVFAIIIKLNFNVNAVINDRLRIILSVVVLFSILGSRIILKTNEFLYFMIAAVYIISVSYINHNLIGQVLSYLLFYLIILLLSFNHVSRRFLFWIRFASLLLYFRFIIYGRSYDDLYLLGALNGNTNIYINPSMLGGFIFVLLLYWGIYIRTRYKKRERLYFFIACILTFIFEILMQDRTMMIGVILLYILSFDKVLDKFNSKKRVKFMISMSFAVSIIIPFVVTTKWYDRHWTIVRTLLSGRDYVWYKYFQLLDGDISKFVFGMGAEAEDLIRGSLAQGSSMHNGFFQMILYFGFTSVLLLYFFLMSEVNNMYSSYVNRTQVFIMTCFIIILLMSSMEIMLQQSTYSMYIGCLLGMAINGRENLCYGDDLCQTG